MWQLFTFLVVIYYKLNAAKELLNKPYNLNISNFNSDSKIVSKSFYGNSYIRDPVNLNSKDELIRSIRNTKQNYQFDVKKIVAFNSINDFIESESKARLKRESKRKIKMKDRSWSKNTLVGSGKLEGSTNTSFFAVGVLAFDGFINKSQIMYSGEGIETEMPNNSPSGISTTSKADGKVGGGQATTIRTTSSKIKTPYSTVPKRGTTTVYTLCPTNSGTAPKETVPTSTLKESTSISTLCQTETDGYAITQTIITVPQLGDWPGERRNKRRNHRRVRSTKSFRRPKNQ